MTDSARSNHPGVQEQLERLNALSPGKDVLGLSRIEVLCARLGNPQNRLPPTIHIAGTNGKGSTCAFLRAMLEAEGMAVHAFTSPHLVRFNERFRLAGKLIDDDRLADALKRVLDVNDIGASFFEVATAAAFVCFSETSADALILEVGLGGRLDATNIISTPVACGIASLGIDHEAFLLAEEQGTPTLPMARIGYEKAGIAKCGVPLITQHYAQEVQEAISATAVAKGTSVIARGASWSAEILNDGICYRDSDGEQQLPLPMLNGTHQADNAALAVAILRHQNRLSVSEAAIAEGIRSAKWPARLQLLGKGPIEALRKNTKIWLDGGHNVDAAYTIAKFLNAKHKAHLVLGMLANKNATDFLNILAPHVFSMTSIPVPGHEHHSPETLLEIACLCGIDRLQIATDPAQALQLLPEDDKPTLIAGSLYVAGQVLEANLQFPD